MGELAARVGVALPCPSPGPGLRRNSRLAETTGLPLHPLDLIQYRPGGGKVLPQADASVPPTYRRCSGVLSEVTSRDQRLSRRSRARVLLRIPTTRSYKRAFARFVHCRYRTRQRGREPMLISRARKTYTAAKRKIGCDPLCTILTECAGRLRRAEIKSFA